MKILNFDHLQKLLPPMAMPLTLAISVEKMLCDILSQERVISLT